LHNCSFCSGATYIRTVSHLHLTANNFKKVLTDVITVIMSVP
jgi:hypothetical protein